jgi:hypothetical protein
MTRSCFETQQEFCMQWEAQYMPSASCMRYTRDVWIGLLLLTPGTRRSYRPQEKTGGPFRYRPSGPFRFETFSSNRQARWAVQITDISPCVIARSDHKPSAMGVAQTSI